MDANNGKISHNEEQSRNTLHYDDKEKLRKKSAQLQREYLKTAQRLKRAERLDAVRRHMKSKISSQKHEDYRDPDVTSESWNNASTFIFNQNFASSGSPLCQGTVDSDTSKREQAIRFSLARDLACPQPPDSSNDVTRSHRPKPAMRLRSRHSRLRWEKRSADALKCSDNSQQEQNKNQRTADKERTIKEDDVVNGSEMSFFGPESESNSSSLTHWSTQEEPTETGDKSRKGSQRPQEEREKKSYSQVEGKNYRSALTTEGGVQHIVENNYMTNKEGGDSVGQNKVGETVAYEEGNHENTEHNAAQMRGTEKHEDFVEIKKEKNQITADEKAANFLDSCTVVEGLLFPVEYYVRTTRRMTFSQSQPNMQAIISSQSSMGRHRRSRVRSRGTNMETQHSDRHTQTNSTPSTSVECMKPSINSSKDFCHSSSDISSHFVPETAVSLPVPSVHPSIGRKKGKGGRRPQRQQLLKQGYNQTRGGPQLSSSTISSTQLISQANETNSKLVSSQQSLTYSCPAQPSLVSGAPTSPTAGHPENDYPIFSKSSTNRSQQMKIGTSDWQSPFSSSFSLSQTSQLSFPFLINHSKSLDIQQDFHSPDEQFASLKSHKLRQVAVESGLEHFSGPSQNSQTHSNCLYSTINPQMPYSFSYTSTSTNSPFENECEQTFTQQTEHIFTDNSTSKFVNEEFYNANFSETNELNANTHNTSTESVLLVQEFIECCKSEKHVAKTQNCPVLNSTDKSINCAEPQAHQSVNVEHSDETKDEQSASEKQTSLEDPQFIDKCITEKMSFDLSDRKTAAVAPNSCTNSNIYDDAAAKPPVNNLILQYSAEDFKEPTRTSLSNNRIILNGNSQFLCKSPSDSMGYTFSVPDLPSSTIASSMVSPSSGITPNAARSTSSPSAASAWMPSSISPSITSLPPSLPCPALCSQIQNLMEPPALRDHGDRDEPAAFSTPSRIQLHNSTKMRMTTKKTAEKCLMKCPQHTSEAPAGGSSVDVCCFSSPSVGLCVVAAGKWAVCLWIQNSEFDWSFKHTWTFSEPVINLFPVPDSTGLILVSSGQSEVRQLRMSSCCSLRETSICEGIIHAAAGLSNSRVVSCSDTAEGSTLQVFTSSESSSLGRSQPLVSPGVCVSSLAPVEGLSDALIGTEEGQLFIWNVKTGQSSNRVSLENSLSNTACLKGYSYSGVLLVSSQHQLLSSSDQEEKKPREKNSVLSEDRFKPALFSLVTINPMSGKSLLASQSCPPIGWTGRLCEVDVNQSSIVGSSQNGCVCVWELKESGTSQTMEAPEDEDWQSARWGEGDMSLIGHQNGDISLHSYGMRSTQQEVKNPAHAKFNIMRH